MKRWLILGIGATFAVREYPGPYPELGKTSFSFGTVTYKFDQYIDSGASTRVYSGTRTSGKSSDYPDEVAIKCLYSTNHNLQSKPAREYRILQALSKFTDLHIPRAYYLSDQWACGGSHKCQFLVMTKAGPDFDRIITRNTLKLEKSTKGSKCGRFELFVASVGMSVLIELEKLHRAGALHGDIGRYNVANSLQDPVQVVLIDFGQAKLKADISESQFKHGIERDYRRTQAFILRLIKTKMGIDFGSSSDRQFRENKLYTLIESVGDPMNSLKSKLENFLKSEFGKNFDGEIIF
jgi:serine/threonine protein kinase